MEELSAAVAIGIVAWGIGKFCVLPLARALVEWTDD